jgi:CheY-like chemotaxis protein
MDKILVIDDHVRFNAQISELITSMYPHVQVFQAHNGREGLELALNSLPDVILIDMHIPVMDGIEAARALRAMPETRHIPLIAMTLVVNDQSQTLFNFRQICNAIIFKPFQATHLAVAMQESGLHL